MRAKLTIIAIFLMAATLTLKGQDSIPNKGFEQWNNANSPVNWETTNIFLPPDNYACSQTTDSYEGDYALMLKTVKINESLIPGVATLGHIVLYSTEGGIPYTLMPTALRAFIKHPSSGDNILIAVQFFKEGTAIGGGVFQTADSIPDYTEVVIPVSFTKAVNPDTVNISIVTDTGIPGSTLIIDNLSFDVQTSADEPVDPQNNILLYPNPATNEFHIMFPVNKNYKIVIMNPAGKIIEKRNSDSCKETFDTKGFTKGLYFISLFSDVKKITKTLVIK